AESAGAVRHRVGVALNHLDFLDRHAESRRQDLSERRGVSLAVIVGSEHGAHRAIGLDADGCGFIEAYARAERACKARPRNAGGLDVAGHADAPQPPAPRRLRAALVESVIVGERKRAREDSWKIAAVIGRANRRLVGHRARRDEIAAADLRAVDAKFLCRA